MRRIITFIKGKFADFKASIKRKQIKMKTTIQEDFTPNSQLTAEQLDAKRMRSISRITTGLMAATMAVSCYRLHRCCSVCNGLQGRFRRQRSYVPCFWLHRI